MLSCGRVFASSTADSVVSPAVRFNSRPIGDGLLRPDNRKPGVERWQIMIRRLASRSWLKGGSNPRRAGYEEDH